MTYSRSTPQSSADTALQYLETRLRTASSVELTIIVYDVLLESLARGADATEAGRIEERVHAVNRAVCALVELRCALDHERGGEIARSLDRLYTYGLSQVTAAHDSRSAESLRTLRRIFAPLRDAWASIAEGAPAAAPATVEATAGYATMGQGVMV